MWPGRRGKPRWDHLLLKLYLHFLSNTFYLHWVPQPHIAAAALVAKWIHCCSYTFFFFLPWMLGCMSPFKQHPTRSHLGPYLRNIIKNWTLNQEDMFSPSQMVSTLFPAVFHSPAAHFFPAFPARLSTPPQFLIPGPFFSYESLRNYLQPEACKESLLLATQAVGIGPLAESEGEF